MPYMLSTPTPPPPPPTPHPSQVQLSAGFGDLLYDMGMATQQERAVFRAYEVRMHACAHHHGWTGGRTDGWIWASGTRASLPPPPHAGPPSTSSLHLLPPLPPPPPTPPPPPPLPPPPPPPPSHPPLSPLPLSPPLPRERPLLALLTPLGHTSCSILRLTEHRIVVNATPSHLLQAVLTIMSDITKPKAIH